jgi:hypothetical protein
LLSSNSRLRKLKSYPKLKEHTYFENSNEILSDRQLKETLCWFELESEFKAIERIQKYLWYFLHQTVKYCLHSLYIMNRSQQNILSRQKNI